ncbi:MAG: hypothetical protein IJY23_06160 [Clostridia bacterium]|nr:hypothetical protein [Clostridia bacterium]
MEKIFIYLLNVSISAGFLVLAVLLFRLIFKKSPKYISVILWGLVAIRLMIPVSIESNFSLIPSKETVPGDIAMEKHPAIDSGIPAVNEIVNPIISSSLTPKPYESANPIQITTAVISFIWIIGLILMISYFVLSYIVLKGKMRESVILYENVYVSDRAGVPFILGILKPKIYLPSDLKECDRDFIISHEEAHISRLDHLWKPLAFLILSVYWFNPLIWVAYIFLSRDIELACDEKVMRNYEEKKKTEYAEALLRCSMKTHGIKACPLAFGEVGVKPRIRAIANYTKPAVVIIILSIIATVILAACFLTYKKSDKKSISPGIYYSRGVVYSGENKEYEQSESFPLFIFLDNGTLMTESYDIKNSTFTSLGELNKCYLSKKDYRSLFEGNFGIDYLRERNASVFKIDYTYAIDGMECDELYVFFTEDEEVYLGIYTSESAIKVLYRLNMNEALPTNFLQTTYREASDINEGLKTSLTINPADNTMVITFGLFSSHSPLSGTYEFENDSLIFTDRRTPENKCVFDLSGDSLIFNFEKSTFAAAEDGTEFKRHYQIYPVPATSFYDLGDDGRYELVSVRRSEIDGEFALLFEAYARGEKFNSSKIPFEKYDYINLEKDKSGNLILVCENKNMLLKTDKFYVDYYDGKFIITRK